MPVPAWKMFWNLFGASNQLLAALTLLGVTVWLWRTRREAWVWLVTGVPTAFMYAMSTWALASLTLPRFRGADGWTLPADPVPWAGLVLLALAAVMLVEAILAIVEPRNPSGGLSKRAVGSRLAGARPDPEPPRESPIRSGATGFPRPRAADIAGGGRIAYDRRMRADFRRGTIER